MEEKKRKKYNINVRLNEGDYNRIVKNAEGLNMSISDYARHCLLKDRYEGIHPVSACELYTNVEEIKLMLIRTFQIMQKCSERYPLTKTYLNEIEKEYIKIWDL